MRDQPAEAGIWACESCESRERGRFCGVHADGSQQRGRFTPEPAHPRSSHLLGRNYHEVAAVVGRNYSGGPRGRLVRARAATLSGAQWRHRKVVKLNI